MLNKLEEHVIKLKNGDKNSFDYIYESTYKNVYFTALYILKDKSLSEDVLQDTYLKAYTKLSYYKPNTNFTGWLVSIAKNTAINYLNRMQKEQLTDMEKDAGRFKEEFNEPSFIYDIALKVLKEDEYKILMLCEVAGYKRREVAKMLDIPIGTVTWKNNQALKKLKEELVKGGIKS